MRKLWQHQVEGVNWLIHNKRGFLWDEPGLGKTTQVLAALKKLNANRTLVLCGKAQASFWADEAKIILGNQPVYLLNKSGSFRQEELGRVGQGIVILNRQALSMPKKYPILEQLLGLKFDAVIVDEAHHFRNRNSGMSKALLKLKSDIRWGLTATPQDGDPRDVWLMLHWILPHQFTSYWKFSSYFCDFMSNGFSNYVFSRIKPSKMQDLADTFATVSLRRTKVEVMPHLPKIRPMRIIWVDLSPQERKAYTEMERGMLTWLDGSPIAAPTALAQLTRLRQLATSPESLGGARGTKMEMVEDLINDLDYKIVVASQYRDVVGGLSKRLLDTNIKHTIIVGGSGDASRLAKSFNTNDHKVLLMTAQTGGEGLNLESAKQILITDLPWSSIELEQLIHRIHRGTSKHKWVQATVFLTRNTVDEDIWEVQKKRGKLNQRLMVSELRNRMRRRLNIDFK